MKLEPDIRAAAPDQEMHRKNGLPGTTPPLALACMAACVGFGFLFALGGYPLLDNNEGLYAEIAREMLAQREFLIPHLLGVPYIEKPPLLYWLMALSMSLFGAAESSVRLVPAGATAMLCIALFLACRRHAGWRTGFYAILIFASAWPILLVSRTVLFDGLLNALLSGALLCFFQWYTTRAARWLRHGAVLLGLAVLVKGGVALVLTAGIVILFACLMRDLAALRGMADGKAAALFLLTILPWHAAAALAQEGFIWFYVVNEHLLRFAGMREPRDFHTGPLHHYLIRLPAMLLPWTPFLLLALGPAQKTAQGTAQSSIKTATLHRFCVAWLLFPLLFFTLSRAKAHYYLLVSAPACAMLMAIAIERYRSGGRARALSACMALAGATWAAAAVLLAMHGDGNGWSSSLALPGAAALGMACGWQGGRHLFYRARCAPRHADMAMAGLAAMALLLMALGLAQLRGKAEQASSRDVAHWINQHAGRDARVYAFRHYEDVFSSLPFYLGRTIGVVDSRSSDLLFGCLHAQAGRSPCLDFSALASGALGQETLVLAVLKSDADEFRALADAMTTHAWSVGLDGDKMVFIGLPHAVQGP